jgi:chromosome segregation ATPase
MKQPADPIPDSISVTPARRALRFLARLALVVLAGIVLGIAVYYGLPAVYRDFVQPVQVNTQRLAEVEVSIEAERQADRERLQVLERRMTQVEADLAAATEVLAATQADLRELLAALGEQGGDLQRVRDLETQLEAVTDSLDSAEDRLAAVEEAVAGSQAPVEALGQRVQLLRAMELVLRARLALADNNPGLAAQDLRSARSILSASSAPPSWEPIVVRLETALVNLDTSPLVAIQDVEAAWYLMLEASAP